MWFRWTKNARARRGPAPQPSGGLADQRMRDLEERPAGDLGRVLERAVEEGAVHRGRLVLEPTVPALPRVDVGDVEERPRRAPHDEADGVGLLVAMGHDGSA